MREYPGRPVIGVGAVIIEDEKILLVRRANEPNKNMWSIPGGLVRVGESLHEALKREILEEIGVEIEIGDVACVTEEIFLDKDGRIKYHYVIVDFFAKIKSGEIKAGSDAKEVKWIKLDELGEDVVPFVRKLVEKILREEKMIYLPGGKTTL
ncbi:NUDIX hydrolase [Ferroglobus sp.]|uniref:NUDIX hydrolase n=1 Tax=Ferroglobus sp. TaxID=2614230 RepID=UPI0025BC975E|nr:NUDIX hydrolase [Ferroglobus sp.]